MELNRRQVKFTFANEWWVSVINDGYGAESGKYELMVVAPDGTRLEDALPGLDAKEGSGIIGWLTDDDVASILRRVASLRRVTKWEEA